MKLCMFSPAGRRLERGWPGRIAGDRVVQLAAQTLQSFFTGGGHAREHAEYALGEIDLCPPVLHPPSVRLFDDGDFAFANPASVYGPEAEVPIPDGATRVEYALRLAAVIGAEGRIGGFTIMNDWRAPELPGAKATDFALSLGPVVVTADEPVPALDEVDWDRLTATAARNTRLLAGDIIAAPPADAGTADGIVGLEVEGIGVLRNRMRR